MNELDLTILMPCLNEEENIASSISSAQSYLSSIRDRWNHTGEILIVDNNSTDRSAAIASECGARVIKEDRRGYGNALIAGLKDAKGSVIIYGDCDSTYDFRNLDSVYLPLINAEADFITGNRFAGLMEPGSMSLSHRLGVPFLSWCGRIKSGVQIHDWHCGLRGIRKDALKSIHLTSAGMEFASEIIVEAARHKLRILEVSVALRKAENTRNEKLRTVRDGLRHLWYIIKA